MKPRGSLDLTWIAIVFSLALSLVIIASIILDWP